MCPPKQRSAQSSTNRQYTETPQKARNASEYAPEAPAAQYIKGLGAYSVTYPQPPLQVMVEGMLYMGLILVRAQRQHAVGGNESKFPGMFLC